MRNDPLNPFFDVSGLVHVCMYVRARVRMCARMRVCEAVCLWLSMVPRILFLLPFPPPLPPPPKPPIPHLKVSSAPISRFPALQNTRVLRE